MPPSCAVLGGQYDAKYVTFEYLPHAAFLAETIWGGKLAPAGRILGLFLGCIMGITGHNAQTIPIQTHTIRGNKEQD